MNQIQANELIEKILWGCTLEDKLVNLQPAIDQELFWEKLVRIPDFPGRPDRLRKLGRALFPKDSSL